MKWSFRTVYLLMFPILTNHSGCDLVEIREFSVIQEWKYLASLSSPRKQTTSWKKKCFTQNLYMIRNSFHQWSKTFKRPLSTSQNKFDMPYKPLCELFLLVHADATLLSDNTVISIPMTKLVLEWGQVYCNALVYDYILDCKKINIYLAAFNKLFKT